MAQAARDWLGTYHHQERLGRKMVWPSFGSGKTWKWQQADVLWETSVKSQGVRVGFLQLGNRSKKG